MCAMTAVRELPGLDKQNGAVLGRLLGERRLERAEEGSDGRMRARVRIPPDELVWDPSIVVMPHGGDIELEVVNDEGRGLIGAIVVLGDVPPEARLDRPAQPRP